MADSDDDQGEHLALTPLDVAAAPLPVADVRFLRGDLPSNANEGGGRGDAARFRRFAVLHETAGVLCDDDLQGHDGGDLFSPGAAAAPGGDPHDRRVDFDVCGRLAVCAVAFVCRLPGLSLCLRCIKQTLTYVLAGLGCAGGALLRPVPWGCGGQRKGRAS